MKTLSENQQLVFNEALRKLKNKKWFKGVCCDDFPSEEDCAKHFGEAVGTLMFKTAMWDDPNFFRG
jgi:hypothetical protein